MSNPFTIYPLPRIKRIMRLVVVALLIGLPVFAAASEACIDVPQPDASTADERELASLYERISWALERFPSLARAVAAKSPQLCFVDRIDFANGYFEPEKNRIVISRNLTKDTMAGFLLHEIRHLDQVVAGACPADSLAMKEYASAVLALEADASAVSLLVAWDMKEHGDPGPWRALSSWDAQSDIASRFEEVMIASGSAEEAVSAAFQQWFASEARRDLYYRSACSGYLDRQDASHALPRYQRIPVDYYANLCRLPNGDYYSCSEAIETPR